MYFTLRVNEKSFSLVIVILLCKFFCQSFNLNVNIWNKILFLVCLCSVYVSVCTCLQACIPVYVHTDSEVNVGCFPLWCRCVHLWVHMQVQRSMMIVFLYDVGVCTCACSCKFRGHCWWSFSMTHHLIFKSSLFHNFIYAKCVLIKAIAPYIFQTGYFVESMGKPLKPPASNSSDTRITTKHCRHFMCSLQTTAQVPELAQQALRSLRALLAWTFLLL